MLSLRVLVVGVFFPPFKQVNLFLKRFYSHHFLLHVPFSCIHCLFYGTVHFLDLKISHIKVQFTN